MFFKALVHLFLLLCLGNKHAPSDSARNPRHLYSTDPGTSRPTVAHPPGYLRLASRVRQPSRCLLSRDTAGPPPLRGDHTSETVGPAQRRIIQAAVVPSHVGQPVRERLGIRRSPWTPRPLLELQKHCSSRRGECGRRPSRDTAEGAACVRGKHVEEDCLPGLRRGRWRRGGAGVLFPVRVRAVAPRRLRPRGSARQRTCPQAALDTSKRLPFW